MENELKKKTGRRKGMSDKYKNIISDIENRLVSGEILGTLSSIKRDYNISSYSNVYRILDILTQRGIIYKQLTVYKYK